MNINFNKYTKEAKQRSHVKRSNEWTSPSVMHHSKVLCPIMPCFQSDPHQPHQTHLVANESITKVIGTFINNNHYSTSLLSDFEDHVHTIIINLTHFQQLEAFYIVVLLSTTLICHYHHHHHCHHHAWLFLTNVMQSRSCSHGMIPMLPSSIGRLVLKALSVMSDAQLWHLQKYQTVIRWG